MPCLASCLGAHGLRTLFIPEIPSGHLEVPREEGSGWAVRVAVQAPPILTLFQAHPWREETEPQEPGRDELSGPALLAQTCNPNCS